MNLTNKNTPWRWRIISKWMSEQGMNFNNLDDNYKAVLLKARDFALNIETGTGNQPGVGDEIEPTRVTGVSIQGGDQSLTVSTSATLLADIEPSSAADKRVTWSSDNPDAVSVDTYSGIITAVGEADDTAVITVTTHDGGFEDTATITLVS